jgi:hypothetical protein
VKALNILVLALQFTFAPFSHVSAREPNMIGGDASNFQTPTVESALWIIIPVVVLATAVITVGFILSKEWRNNPANTSPSNTPILYIKHGQQTGQRFTLNKIPCLIGRDASNEICLNDPHIARQHAQILALSNGYGLVDLGSKEGTFLNGKPVPTQPVLLKSGDVVRIGGVLLVFGA